jgi:protein-tyrosine-phosphatase
MNILFICDGNVARSQEAELFVNKLSNGKHHAVSAGVNPKIGKPIDPLVIEAMREVGYTMDASVRKPINEAVADKADMIISFKPAEELPEFVQHYGNVRYWSVADPARQSIEVHRKVRNLVKAKVESLLSEI